MAGAARNLKYPLVYKSIQANVIKALGGGIKLFAYLKMQETASSDRSSWSFWPGQMNTREDELKEALDHLKPEVLKFSYNDTKIPQNPSCPFTSDWFRDNPARVQRALGQFNTLSECFKLVKDYEKREGFEFDMVVKVRPDAAWLYAVPPWCSYSASRIYGPKYLDHFNVMSREHAHAVFETLKFYQEESRDASWSEESPDLERGTSPENESSARDQAEVADQFKTAKSMKFPAKWEGPDVGEANLTTLGRKKTLPSVVSDIGGQNRGESIMKMISQQVPKTVLESGFQQSKLIPIFSLSKLSKWTLRFQDANVEREFILFYNRRFSRVNEILAIVVAIVSLNLLINGSYPKNFLTPLFVYALTYATSLYTTYNRELRLRLIFLMEYDLSTTLQVPHLAISQFSTDDLYIQFKLWCHGKTIDFALPERKKTLRERHGGSGWWKRILQVEALRNEDLEAKFLDWQHEGIMWIFRMELLTIAVNEVIRAFLDGVA
ncbi:hypothetical protein HDU97_008593 [Phlyctochytrium planicorne]|nr:hypothetical protein HDU97_008593 [Phlyctochytrium planicorne]